MFEVERMRAQGFQTSFTHRTQPVDYRVLCTETASYPQVIHKHVSKSAFSQDRTQQGCV